jgi:3-oxoadipate enol-lactonase
MIWDASQTLERIIMKRNVAGISLNVEENGTGDTSLVFLHYWGGTHRTWNKVARELAGSFHTVTYDMRGWGQSDTAQSGYSIKELANEAASLIGQLGLTKYVLVGHSMGGKVAQLLASRHPTGLAGLVLVAPAAPTPTRFPEAAKQQQIHAYDNRDTVLQTIAFLSARTPDPDIVEQIVEGSLSGAPEAKLAWPTSAILEDISVEVPHIAVPTLVLAGEHDHLDSVEQHRREILVRIPNSRLEIIHDSGHLIPIDEPVRLARAISTFLAELHA